MPYSLKDVIKTRNQERLLQLKLQLFLILFTNFNIHTCYPVVQYHTVWKKQSSFPFSQKISANISYQVIIIISFD